MDPNLRRVILLTWDLIKRAAANHTERVDCTVAMVETLRPQMTRDDARAAVRFVLRHRAG